MSGEVVVDDGVGDRYVFVVPVGGVGACPLGFVAGDEYEKCGVVVDEAGEYAENQVVWVVGVKYAGTVALSGPVSCPLSVRLPL
jgi:hypothetical protein